MRLLRATLFLALASAACVAQGANLDFNLASNAVGADFSTNLTDTGLEGSLGFMHHSDRADVMDAGLDLVGNASPVGSPLIFGVGAKFFYIAPEHINNGEVGSPGTELEFAL